jgi:hypothetical protein
MGKPLAITRTEHAAADLRVFAAKSRDGAQVRRLLALAFILDGHLGSNDENANDPLGWLGCLTDAAIAGITPPTAAPTPPSLGRPRRKPVKPTPPRQMGDDEFELT